MIIIWRRAASIAFVHCVLRSAWCHCVPNLVAVSSHLRKWWCPIDSKFRPDSNCNACDSACCSQWKMENETFTESTCARTWNYAITFVLVLVFMAYN